MYFLSVVAAAPFLTFDGAPATTLDFVELNDPVMGGLSVGTWSVQDGYGIMNGSVVDVPSLDAPGFIKASADGHLNISGDALVVRFKTSTPSYSGFRITLATGSAAAYSCSGGGQIPMSRGCFKADLKPVINFSDFSDLWSPSTGEILVTCAEDPSACVQPALESITRVEFWAEGVDGLANLQVESLETMNSYEHCTVQSSLLYNMSDILQDYMYDENLPNVVCCDSRQEYYAEPQFLYQLVDFFPLDGVTTFYDSNCGLPLFQAPKNRTMQDFEDDTQEHGWPSFRAAEVFYDNVLVDHDTGLVSSTCGTHLGTFLPDDQGDRYCIDLSCIAGTPSSPVFNLLKQP